MTLSNEHGHTIASQSFAVPEGHLQALELVLAQDALGRPTHTRNLGNLDSFATYDCCGMASETDVQGITTTYTRDMLNRVRQQSRLGITTTYSSMPSDKPFPKPTAPEVSPSPGRPR